MGVLNLWVRRLVVGSLCCLVMRNQEIVGFGGAVVGCPSVLCFDAGLLVVVVVGCPLVLLVAGLNT